MKKLERRFVLNFLRSDFCDACSRTATLNAALALAAKGSKRGFLSPSRVC